MKKIRSLFLKLSNMKNSIIILNIICIVPSVIILYFSFSFLNLILMLLLLIISNTLFILIKKENNKILKKMNYQQFLENLTLFCFYHENDFEKFLSISNCTDSSNQIVFYKNENSYMSSNLIVETVKKYKTLKYHKTLEQAVELIEKEQDKLEEELSYEINEKKGILPLLLISVFFATFIFSIVSLIIGGLNA